MTFKQPWVSECINICPYLYIFNTLIKGLSRVEHAEKGFKLLEVIRCFVLTIFRPNFPGLSHDLIQTVFIILLMFFGTTLQIFYIKILSLFNEKKSY